MRRRPWKSLSFVLAALGAWAFFPSCRTDEDRTTGGSGSLSGAAAMVKEGARAPAFGAETDEGKRVALSDFRGKTVVLYFFPKADTPG
jgi:cytochrome oxidase Cu insertion factor (SCO1/SenC/PrrC family)